MGRKLSLGVMQRIGQWIRNLLDDEFVAPQEIADTMDRSLRLRIADYLASGREIARYRCRDFCLYRCRRKLPRIDRSDGFWVWRAEYEHSVRFHGAPVPYALVETVLSGKAPGSINDDSAESDAYWRDWCAAHRNPMFLDELKQARMIAHAELARDLAEQTLEMVRQRGEGRGSCAYARCGQSALNGLAICARHTVLGHASPERWGVRHFQLGPLLRRWTALRTERDKRGLP